MNPEFERNIWLELAPRRVILMVVLLGLAFFAASVSDRDMFGHTDAPVTVARVLYIVIVILWGTRNAALSVVGEIRERTWDGQRLSSLGAWAMTWAKLFGATLYNWLGGAICLAVMGADFLVHQGPGVAVVEVVYFIALGVIAQAASLLASLVAVRRRPAHSGLDVFLYQLVGLIAAGLVSFIWTFADPVGLNHVATPSAVMWWNMACPPRTFLLVSLALFAAWTFVGCYRMMRVELQMRNNVTVWTAFLIFMGIYAAGFGQAVAHPKPFDVMDVLAARLFLADLAFAGLAYVMVLLEPKDRVHYRWLAAAAARGEIATLLAGLQAWMVSWFAALAAGAALIVWLGHTAHAPQQALMAAALGFFTRDMALVVLMSALSRRRRGTLAAVVVLFALYILAPVILHGLHIENGLVLFFPRLSSPAWLSPAIAWVEAALAAIFAVGHVALADKDAEPRAVTA